jgi:hypothetical protein
VRCSSNYSTLKNCFCDIPDQIPKKRKQSNCQHCGLDFTQGSKHVCYHSQCHSCRLFFKSDSNDLLRHRCPLFASTNAKPAKFKDEPAEEGFEAVRERTKPYCLWLYDLESCIVPVEGHIPSFVLNQYGYFDKDGASLKIINRPKSIQIPNLVVYKNVLTGERKSATDKSIFVRKCFLRTMEGTFFWPTTEKVMIHA